MGLESNLSRDVDFQELERQDLLTGEPRYTEDEVRNTTISTILAGLATLLMLIVFIMSYVLYARHRTGSLLAFAIITTILFLVAIICLVWSMGAGGAVKQGRQADSLFSLIVFILAITAMGYLLVMCMWLAFYLPVHHDYIVGVFATPGRSNERFRDSWDFETAWRVGRRMLYWIITLSLVAAFCFGIIAYTATSVVWNRYQMIRYALYYALAWMTLAAWLTIYWCQESFERQNFLDNAEADTAVKGLKILAIVALVIAFLNMIVNVIKSKLGYFVFGIICIGLLIILVCVDAPLWRHVRREQIQEVNNGADRSCTTTMYSIHENDLNDYCGFNGGKYLPAGQTCSKEFIVSRYEVNPEEIRSLNPNCCLSAKHFYLYPYMLLALWGLVLILATALAMACNFYLADTTEYLTNANKSLGIVDYLFIAIILLLSIAWGIYFIARKSGTDNAYATKTAAIKSYNDPQNNQINGWDLVPTGILANTNPNRASQPAAGSVCFPYNTTLLPNPTFQTTGSACTDPNTCSIRIAIAVRDAATFQFGDTAGAAKAFGDNRYAFFPQCAGTVSDYALFYGTQDQVKGLLQNLRICPKSTTDTPRIVVYTDQVKTADIGNNGLVAGETSSNDAANQNTPLCAQGYTSNSCASVGVCKFTTSLGQQAFARALKGRFYFIVNGQKRFDIPNTITMTTSDGNGNIGTGKFLFEDGIFVVEGIPVFREVPYKLRLNYQDTAGTFISGAEDIIIDSRFIGSEIAAGEIRLNTRDGLVCLPFVNTTCINNAQSLRGTIDVVVEDGSAAASSASNDRIVNANINVYRGHITDGTSLVTAVTTSNGDVKFNGLPYNAYTLIASKTGFNPDASFIDLQSPNLSPKPLILTPTVADFDVKVVAEMVSPSTDFDLILQMRSDKNIDCETSPYNKYCPYTLATSDISVGPGTETIFVKRLSVANYNAFVQQSPPYNANCNSIGFIRSEAYHFRQINSLDWTHLQGSQQVKIFPGMIFTSTIFGGNGNALTFAERVQLAVANRAFVETNAEALLSRTVISANNTPLAVANRFLRNTTFEGNSSLVPPLSNNSNGTLTFVACVNAPAGSINCINGTANSTNVPELRNLSVVNYTLNATAIKSDISIQTNDITFTTNATRIDDDLFINNSLNTTDNTIAKATIRNVSFITPGSTNYSLNNSVVFTSYTNSSVVNQSNINFRINDLNGTNGVFSNRSIVLVTPGGVNTTVFFFDNTTTTNKTVSVNNDTDLQVNGSVIINRTLIVGSSAPADTFNLYRAQSYSNGTNIIEYNFSNFTVSGNVNTSKVAYFLDIKRNGGINTTFLNNTNTTFDNVTLANLTTVNFLNLSTLTNGSVLNASMNKVVSNVIDTSVTQSNDSNLTNSLNSTFIGNPAGDYYNLSSVNFTSNSTFNLSTGASADSISYQSLLKDIYNISYSASLSSTINNCNISKTSTLSVRANQTNNTQAQLNRSCLYRNGSTVVFQNTSFIQVINSSGVLTYNNNSNLTIAVTYANGTTENFSVSQSVDVASPVPGPTRRRMLLADHAHLQGQGNTVISTAVTGGNFIWISCFTGFGEASAIFINSIQNDKPSVNACIDRIRNERPNFTVEKLRDAVKNFKA